MDKAERDEQGRLDTLKSYAILDTPPETDFDQLTRLAAQICATPIATVSLIDERRQWFKSALGLDIAETDRAIAFCAHAIHGTGLYLVPDASQNPLFANNPLVTGEPGLRFYAAMPLLSPGGFALGTMAVMDRVPRVLTATQLDALNTLARQVMVLLELRLQRRLFESSVNENAERFAHLAMATTDALWDWDLQTGSIRWNQGIQTLFGVPLHELGPGSTSWTNRIHPDDRDRVLQDIHAVIGGQLESWGGEYRFQRMDGSWAHVVDRGFVIRDAEGRAVRMVGGMTDDTARRKLELERQHADARIRKQASLLDKAKDAIIVRGIDLRVQYWNKGAERLYGWTSEEAIGSAVDALLHDDAAAFAKASNKVLELGEWTGEVTQRRKDGSSFLVEGHWTLMKDENGNAESILAINTDITHRKAAENEIQQLAFFDLLTCLPNRQLLLDRLQHALALSARTRSTGALLFIDLDNFKALNDTLGHEKGDQLLQQVASRLSGCVRNSDTVARLGGDEFVVILEDLNQDSHEAAAHARGVGETMLSALNQPYRLTDHDHFSSPSIGVTLFNGDDADVGELLKRAELAMYQAKAAGRNTLRFFEPDMQTAATARAELEADLRLGLQNKEFLVHYQPQVDGQGHPIGAEALLRWRHPRRGLVPPAEFIRLAEDTGLILPLGQWVLESACTQLASWAARPETARLTMAVNVSARQFRHPGFIGQVLAVLERTGADPHQLKLELTEGLLIDDVEETIATMLALKAQGVGFSLDDFGTGYSSLAYLKRLPLDQLKIDQSFVRDVLSDANDATIARTIVTLGQSLGLAVIAEGVETEAQRDFLARHNCDAFQGYLFSHPLPADQLDAFLLARAGCRILN